MKIAAIESLAVARRGALACAIVLLISAAILKLMHPVGSGGTWNLVLPLVEIGLAGWLVSGLSPVAANLFVGFTFGVFAIRNIVVFANGTHDCGCFGSAVHSSPALLGIVDTTCCLGLLWPDRGNISIELPKYLRGGALVVGLLTASLVGTRSASAECAAPTSISRMDLCAAGIRDRLGVLAQAKSYGICLVVDDNCGHCQNVLRSLAAHADSLSDVPFCVLSINAEPPDDNRIELSDHIVRQRLPNCTTWVDKVPCLVLMTKVGDDAPSVLADDVPDASLAELFAQLDSTSKGAGLYRSDRSLEGGK